MHSAHRRLAATLVLVAALVWGGLSVEPPPLVDPRGPADFDHQAAWRTLTELATEPHPVGSEANARVRGLIVARLTALGLAPEVQRAVGMNGHATTAGIVHNVLARMDPRDLAPDRRARDAILLVCHYDSRIAAVGAGDDAAGVAALLEALRALKEGPPPRRPVIFLCTDGEEQGLLGAEAFVSQHRWAKEVAVVLNFEARGTAGPALLFETSPGAGRLVRAAAAVAPRITGTSLAGAVYRRMPNDTDLSVFLEQGFEGLNFAFNRGWRHYHTRLDDPAHLDPRSLAHHGRTALELTRRLGGLAVPAPAPDKQAAPARPGPDPVYFNLMPGVFVVYDLPLVRALAAYLVLALGVSCAAYRSSDQGEPGAFPRALIAALAGVLLAMGCGAGVARGAGYLHHHVLGAGDALRSPWYHAASLLAGFGCMTAVMAGVAARFRDAGPAVALVALAIWTALAAATAALFPPASYLFVWPPLLCLLALQRTARRTPAPAAAWYDLLQRAVVPAPAACMLAVMIVLFFDSLGHDVPGGAVAGLLSALATLLAVPLLELSEPRRARHAARLGLGGALCCALAGAVLTRPDAARPDHCWLVYAHDADARSSVWITGAAKPPPWVAARLGVTPTVAPLPSLLVTRSSEPVVHARAPVLELPPPEVKIVSDRIAGDERHLKLRVTSPRAANLFWLALPAPRIAKVRLDGRVLPPPGIRHWGDTPGRHNRRRADPATFWTLEAPGIGPEGFELDLVLKGAKPLAIRICELTTGLPPSLASEHGPMPETLVPYDHGLSTLVARELSL